ncbi:hypothetical protein PBY51_013902 [Eleginops maclovinus]|uniref:Uncharacterized protein n=1 Tax=Eleginops maclovinus TaxID=56733 RepID=A0AAN7WVL6_ELEMC|nr:hypothetical protein PBY51_013902 [Eleginops maclovinus]
MRMGVVAPPSWPPSPLLPAPPCRPPATQEQFKMAACSSRMRERERKKGETPTAVSRRRSSEPGLALYAEPDDYFRTM